MTDQTSPIEIQASDGLRAMTLTADGRQVISGDENGVRVWQVEDGLQVAKMEAPKASCVAVSNDGRWIAAGTFSGDVCLWDVTTYKQVLKHRKDNYAINVVDFSPDSARLISASENCTATLWDIPDGKQLQILDHDRAVITAKYSPRGDKIATATIYSVRVWGSDGASPLDILATASPQLNKGLDWLDSHVFVVSNYDVKEIDASSGSIVHEWSGTDSYRHIALLHHGEFIACCGENTVTFWDASSDTPLGQIQHPQDITSIVFSSHRTLLAVGGSHGKITIHNLSRIVQPEIPVGAAVLKAWKHNQPGDAELLLTAAIDGSRISDHHILACRALVRARQRKWDMALTDAEMSIEIRPSVIGYIAKSMAHIGRDEKHEAYRSCDIAVVRCHSSHATFLLLIKAIIVFIAGERADAISRMDDLIATTHLNSICYVVQTYMLLLHGDRYIESSNYIDAISSLERARAQLRSYPSESVSLVSLIFGWEFDDLGVAIQRCTCEALYSAGRIEDASNSLLELLHSLEKEGDLRGVTISWVSGFTQRYLSRDTNGMMLHANHPLLLREWAKATLASRSWKDALVDAVDFRIPRSTVYWAICERLEANGHIMDTIECILEMVNQLEQEPDIKAAEWIVTKLEDLGDHRMNNRQHDGAIILYSAALSLNPANLQVLFIKRSRACAIMGRWMDALNDANEAVTLDSSSPLGYERRHAALRGAGRYAAADAAFNTMLSKMSASNDTDIRRNSSRYVRPAQTESAIREAIQMAIRESPSMLISTESGRLLDKWGQASLFESRPIFHDLVCSTTTEIDHARIESEVGHYYRYGMFSHKWEGKEPSFEDVIDTVVQQLEESPTHDKLKMLCQIVREAGLNWAWSDTCCINQKDPTVLQEALVSMFKWYEGSALTVVHLLDAPFKRLADCIWNSRAWTFQEYHASKVVRFYNNDWTPYRNLDIPNHKESPEIIAEMEEATGLSTHALVALRPGLNGIREKLRLASTRQSTRAEDAAYSLFGIFSTSLSIKYGEGDEALGRLLARLLMSSGNTSILAWTGKSGSSNSCLPAGISVFKELPTSHIPTILPSAEMEIIVAGLLAGPLDPISATRFYDRLKDLPGPTFLGKRMRLPSISFQLESLEASQNSSGRVFRAQATPLGFVEIKTEENLLQFEPLTLIHPWIDFLLGQQPPGTTIANVREVTTEDQSSPQGELLPLPGPFNSPSSPPKTQMRFPAGFGLSFGQRATPPAETDKYKHAFELLARLRQPFGALLLARDHDNVAAYKRVAAESLITVQVQEITPTILDELSRGVGILGVL